MSWAPIDTDLQSAVNASAWLSEKISSLLGETANVTLNERVAVALFSISLDHREATLLLAHAGARTSINVVARSALEAFVRGLWAESVATEEALVKVLQGEPPPMPKFETAAQAVRKAGHAFAPVIESLRGHYDTLSDYAHGHIRQLSRWISQHDVAPKHSDEEVIESLRFVDVIGILVCTCREKIAERDIAPYMDLLCKVRSGVYYDAKIRDQPWTDEMRNPAEGDANSGET